MGKSGGWLQDVKSLLFSSDLVDLNEVILGEHTTLGFMGRRLGLYISSTNCSNAVDSFLPSQLLLSARISPCLHRTNMGDHMPMALGCLR
jgi:hypothetical protein